MRVSTGCSIAAPCAKALLALLAVLLGAIATCAEDFPSRPIRVIVPFAVGGSADISARLAAEALGRVLGNPVLVENRGGGGGANATEAFLGSEADGYTLLLAAPGPFAILPETKHVGYDVEKDFVPLGMIWRSAQVLSVRRSHDMRTLAAFVAAAKSHAVTIGSAGVGTTSHLTMELLKREAGIAVIHVPFRSTGETLAALIGGQIEAMFSDAQVVVPQVNAGSVRALAVAARQRMPALPDVPTMGEADLPGVIGENWYGLVAAVKTPAPIVQRLQGALAAIHDDPTYKANLERQHASAGEPGAEPFAALIKSDAAKWRAIVMAAGIRL